MGKQKSVPDLRKIRLSQCYTIQQCSNTLGVSVATIRTWIRQGLPTVPNGKPPLIPGDGLKSWLTQRRLSRKQSCKPNELFCCRCRGPRTAKFGSVVITPRNAKAGSLVITPRNSKTVCIRALCGTCNTRMNKGGSLAKRSEIAAAFGLITPLQEHLAECENPTVIQHLKKEPTE
jgi:hypothetical protein